jgi:hypothetical protein
MLLLLLLVQISPQANVTAAAAIACLLPLNLIINDSQLTTTHISAATILTQLLHGEFCGSMCALLASEKDTVSVNGHQRLVFAAPSIVFLPS